MSRFLIGTLLLLGALTASGLLTARHIWALAVAGCGSDGGCDWAVRGPYSKVLGVPVAHLGLAYFAAILYLWFDRRRMDAGGVVRWVARGGVAVSLAFIGIMFLAGRWCPWCLVVHAANVGWWLLIEIGERGRDSARPTSRLAMGLAALLFALTIATTQALYFREQMASQSAAHRAALESIARMSQPLSQTPVDSVDRPAAVVTDTTTSHQTTKTANRFGGRFWLGSTNPTVRLVIFNDYQCELCFQVEQQIKQLLASRKNLALSVKQWPFDADCNPNILTESPHKGACKASRAAEAAGLLGGEQAFWKMHFWLVEHGGQFTDAALDQQVKWLGLDPARFRESMRGRVVDSLLQGDISEGMAYGLKWTPMVFVNGYEVQGWNSAGALPAAIDRATQLALQSPRSKDRPVPAAEMQLRAWQGQRVQSIPVTSDDHTRGPASAPATVIVFGDLTCNFHATARQILAQAIGDSSQVRIVFKDFPLDGRCNDLVTREINPNGCLASKLAHATGLVAGEDAYWRAYQWIVDNRATITSASVTQLATFLGVAQLDLETALSDPRIEARIARNVELAKKLGVDSSPTIFVNGRKAAGWQTPGLLDKVLSAAINR
ncbi:MAG: thioredoxin domain-containing protein [Candidatus Zixiibacteriota bacterium]